MHVPTIDISGWGESPERDTELARAVDEPAARWASCSSTATASPPR